MELKKRLKIYSSKKYIRKRLFGVLVPYVVSCITKRKFFTVLYRNRSIKLSSVIHDEDIMYQHYHAYFRSKDNFSHDRWEQKSVDLSQDANLFIDIGGYNGIFGLLAAKNSPAIKVHIFEPNPLSVYLIYRNIRINNLSNVTLHHAAVGNINGSVSLRIMKNGSRVEPRFKHGIRINCLSIDSLLGTFTEEDLKNVVVKIDAEGFDKQCLEGMKNFIERCKHLNIIVNIHAPEIIQLHDYTNEDVYNLIKNLNLKVVERGPSATNVIMHLKK